VAIPKFVLVVAVVAVCLVPGCAAPNPATYSCTPEVGGEPYACVKEQYDLMVERNKLYAEAEAVYRKAWDEEDSILRKGGVIEPTPVLLETTTGSYLASRMEGYRLFRENQGSVSGGHLQIVWMKRIPDQVSDGSVVAMQSCIDATSVTVSAPGEAPESGSIGDEVAFFVREDNRLKITSAVPGDATRC
jgi:hypothetical protein